MANIPDLDAVLDADEPNDVWANHVLAHARKTVPAEADIRELSVRCAQTFCRVKIVKPRETQTGWAEIDHAFGEVATGEAIFSTETEGNLSTGYLYFAEANNQLPMGNPDSDPDSDREQDPNGV